MTALPATRREAHAEIDRCAMVAQDIFGGNKIAPEWWTTVVALARRGADTVGATEATINDDTITLPSGHTLSANRGIVGLSPVRLNEVYEGYDGQLDPVDFTRPTYEPIRLAAPIRVELADMMIAAWIAYRDEARRCLILPENDK